MTQFHVDPAVPPADWQAAFRKLEAAHAVLLASQARMEATLEALTHQLVYRVVPETLRVTEVVLKVEP